MQTEDVVILKVGTDEAVKSVADLKDNIKVLKSELDHLEVGTQDYQDTLSQLKTNQNALKDAMYASSTSMEELTAAAKGTSETYNSLVHRMASLKEQLRSTDVSTEEGKQKFKELASQVNEVNDRLKEMDAMQGNYQRNVGNYTSALDNLGGVLKQFPPTLGSMKEKIGKVGESMQLVGKQPILGIIGLLAPVIMKITESLKDNATATNAVNKAMASLKPVFDLVGSVIEMIAGWVSKAVDYFVSLAGEGGETFKTIIAGAVGVGNVLLQYILTPVKTIIEAFKGMGSIIKDVFSGDFKKVKADAAEAFDGIKDAFVNGFSFSANFQKGMEVSEQFAAGLGGSKETAKAAGEEIGAAMSEGIENGLERIQIKDEKHNIWQEYLQGKRDAAKESEELSKELAAIDAETEAEVLANMEAFYDEEARLAMENRRIAEEQAQAKIDTVYTVANATSSILSSLADIYENDSEENEKSAKKAKALRIASATIDTISGAVGAYMQSVASIPPPAGIIMGIANAATVTAAGIAQIAKLRSTNVSGSSSSGSGASSSGMSATVSAPSVSSAVQQTSVIRTASEQDEMDKLTASQRVYILQSDIEAAGTESKARVAEASF